MKTPYADIQSLLSNISYAEKELEIALTNKMEYTAEDWAKKTCDYKETFEKTCRRLNKTHLIYCQSPQAYQEHSSAMFSWKARGWRESAQTREETVFPFLYQEWREGSEAKRAATEELWKQEYRAYLRTLVNNEKEELRAFEDTVKKERALLQQSTAEAKRALEIEVEREKLRKSRERLFLLTGEEAEGQGLQDILRRS